MSKYYDKKDLDIAMSDMSSQMMSMEDRLAEIGVSQPHLTTMSLYVATAMGVAHDSYIPVGARLSEVRSIKQNIDDICKELEDQLKQEQKRYEKLGNVVYVNFNKGRKI